MIADQPNFFRVIRTDYWSFVCSILMIVFWALTLFDLFTRQEQMQASLFTAVMISVVTLMIVGWRYYRVSSLYKYGTQTQASIIDIGFFRDRGAIKYTYTFHGEQYTAKLSVMRNKHTREYNIGDKVPILVNPDRPKHSVIRDLFL